MIHQDTPFLRPFTHQKSAADHRPLTHLSSDTSVPPLDEGLALEQQQTSQYIAKIRPQADFAPGAGLFSNLNTASQQPDPNSISASLLRIVKAFKDSQQQPSPSVFDAIIQDLSALKDLLIAQGTEGLESPATEQPAPEGPLAQLTTAPESHRQQAAEATHTDTALSETHPETNTTDEATLTTSGGTSAGHESELVLRSEDSPESLSFDALSDYQQQVRKRIQRTLDQLANTQVFQNSTRFQEIRETFAAL